MCASRVAFAERSAAGVARARAAGKRIGRPGVAWDRERARALRAGGASLRQVASEVGVPVGTLRNYLKAGDPAVS